MPRLLHFSPKSAPILREKIKPVQDFKDPQLHETIADMIYSIRPAQLAEAKGAHKSAAGMAANQWGIRQRIFIFTPEGSDEKNRLEVMLNPSYIPYLRVNEKQPKLVDEFEGCFSVPLTTGIVSRYDAIMATYYTPEGKKIERLMQGWEARVFQHETDHLDGKLFDGKLDHFAGPECIKRFIFKDAEEMEAFWTNEVKPSRER